jgi:ubiquinone/menaquinone biosynthesis C-methylase UbiE
MNPSTFAIARNAGARLLSAVGRLRHVPVRANAQSGQTNRPNDASEWDRLCTEPIVPVTGLHTPVARVMEELTRPGEVLLEAGCGNAAISAELASVGRLIELADFSQGILDRSLKLFEASQLPRPTITLADLTKRLPWPENAVDVTWSSGVLEHWTDEELIPIVREMHRISRRAVVSLVPNAASVFYRLGKELSEQKGVWPYGREIPRVSLKAVFKRAGLSEIREWTVWVDHAPATISIFDPQLYKLLNRWWASLPENDPAKTNQGYLLVTVGSCGH